MTDTTDIHGSLITTTVAAAYSGCAKREARKHIDRMAKVAGRALDDRTINHNDVREAAATARSAVLNLARRLREQADDVESVVDDIDVAHDWQDDFLEDSQLEALTRFVGSLIA